MTPDATTTAPESLETPARWVSVAQASAALNLSEKTVRKRIATGHLESKRVPQKRGGISYLVALETETETELLEAGTEAERKPASVKGQTETEVLHSKRNRNGSGTELEMLHATVERDASEISFLRGVIEQLQRDGAETRASLREALKAPRQLTTGTPGTAPESPISGDNRAGEQIHVGAEKGAQDAPESLSYADIADELERSLNNR
jgi:hypothetical protein